MIDFQSIPIQVNNEKIQYFSMEELTQIHKQYELYSLLEYIQENYPSLNDEEYMLLATEARNNMEEAIKETYNTEEAQAIFEASENLGISLSGQERE